MGFTNYQIGEFLRQLDRSYLSLHFDDPDLAGAYASELFGGSYERKPVDFSNPSNRGITVVSQTYFNGLPPVSITHVGGWDAKIKGNLLFSIAIEKPLRTREGGSFSIPSNSLVLSFD